MVDKVRRAQEKMTVMKEDDGKVVQMYYDAATPEGEERGSETKQPPILLK